LKKKITYIIANIDKAIAFEWVAEKLDKSKFELSFILLNSSEPCLHNWLKERKQESYIIQHEGKKHFLITFFKLLNLLSRINPNIVHTHLFDANLLGLLAAKLLGIKKRIYTRHHSTYHHDNFPHAVKYDKLCNYLATGIVAISQNVKQVLVNKEKVKENKIHLINHGFDLDSFININHPHIDGLKSKYKTGPDNFPIIGVVSRYINWKGIQYIIPAFKKILQEYPNAKLILANANGPDKEYIHSQLATLTKESYIEITFETNLFALYKLFDVFVHVPINKEIEAFGQTYVEALAAEIPSVFTLSGIASEFVENKNNALVVDYKNSEQIHDSIIQILVNKKLRETLIQNGRKSVEQFNLEIFIKKLEQLYV
tara:strand:+ start:3914 stop:5026 length:1113 start_codon:yes stop_codon:yes gene_type:complete